MKKSRGKNVCYWLCKRWQLLYWSNRIIASYIGIGMIEVWWRLSITSSTHAVCYCIITKMIRCSRICLFISQLILCLLATFKRKMRKEINIRTKTIKHCVYRKETRIFFLFFFIITIMNIILTSLTGYFAASFLFFLYYNMRRKKKKKNESWWMNV